MSNRFAVAAFCAAFACVAVSALAAQASCSQSPPRARVTLDLGNGSSATFDIRTFELGVRGAPAGPSTAVDTSLKPSAANAEIRLLKRAGLYTSELVRRSAAGDVSPTATIEVLDSAGAATFTIRLGDAVIASDRVTLSTARTTLEQQRISQQEGLSQLTADYQDAQRELATTEQLGKSRASTPLDLARARERAAELGRRLDLAKQRQALLLRDLDGQGYIDEELTLRFSRIEIANP